jgi:hypothetical protein
VDNWISGRADLRFSSSAESAAGCPSISGLCVCIRSWAHGDDGDSGDNGDGDGDDGDGDGGDDNGNGDDGDGDDSDGDGTEST